MSVDRKPYPGTQAVLRAISLLKVFSDAQPDWGLTELAEEVGLNKTTTYRLLTALDSEGLVTRNPDAETYSLGPEIVALGGRALRSNNLRSTVHPELETLAGTTGETATLELLSDDAVLIIDEVYGDRLLSSGPSIGTRWPAHATSTGLAILAHLPSAEVKAHLQTPLRPYTARTITDRRRLDRELALVRGQGYAVADESLEIGFIAIAAPLRNYDGQVVAAISLGGPSIRLTPERIPEIAGMVRAAAERVSARLGYQA